MLFSLKQFTPICLKLSEAIQKKSNLKDKILLEQTLWTEVKKIRTLNDSFVYSYLIGYYDALLYQINSSSTKPNLLNYYILIRLGDLNRYMKRYDEAEYFYFNARNLFPEYGHAYNQLGLLTKPSNKFKCCYYYARAAKSVEKPLTNIADSNLQIAVDRYNCELLSHIINGSQTHNNHQSSLSNKSSSEQSNLSKSSAQNLPETAYEWFYVLIVAIYADNMKPAAEPFISFYLKNFVIENFQPESQSQQDKNHVEWSCDGESYTLLMCLDVLLDWLKFGSQGPSLLIALGRDLKRIKRYLQALLSTKVSIDNQQLLLSDSHLFGDSNTSSTNTSATDSSQTNLPTTNLIDTTNQVSSRKKRKPSLGEDEADQNKVALPHDYILHGFKPLASLHDSLVFTINFKKDIEGSFKQLVKGNMFVNPEDISVLASRIIDKISMLTRRRSRNIALESILSINFG